MSQFSPYIVGQKAKHETSQDGHHTPVRHPPGHHPPGHHPPARSASDSNLKLNEYFRFNLILYENEEILERSAVNVPRLWR
jgi:hypothetical protein